MSLKNVAGAVVLLSVVFCVQGARGAALDVGHIGSLDQVPLYLAMEKGYLREVGIDVRLHMFASGGEMMAPLASGQLHMAVGGGINIGFFNGVARGMPIVIVADTAQLIPGNDPDHFMVRSDVKEQIKTIGDLKGKKVGLNAPTSALLYPLVKALNSAGLSVKDIDLVTVPFPEMTIAFKNKAFDVALQIEPFATLTEAQGLAAKWKKVSDFVKDPYLNVAGIFYNSDWATKNPAMARNFMVAWLRGVREYLEASRGGANRAEIVSIAVKYTRIKDPALYEKMDWYYMNPNGYVNTRSVEDQMNWYHAQGHVVSRTPIEKFVDDSYVKYALEKIGESREIPRR